MQNSNLTLKGQINYGPGHMEALLAQHLFNQICFAF